MSMVDPMSELRVPTSLLAPPVSPISPLTTQLMNPVAAASAQPLTSTAGLGATAGRAGLGAQAAAFGQSASAGLPYATSTAASTAAPGIATTAGRASSFLRNTPAARVLTAGGRLGTTAKWGARAAAPLVAGFAADAVFGSSDENKWLEAGRGFTRGAGWGPVVAPAFGPGAPVVLAASAITGAIGAALDVFDAGSWFGGGDDEPAVKPDDVLANILESAKLSPEMNEEILTTYAVAMEIAKGLDDKEARATYEAQALASAGDMALQAISTRDSATSAASNTLALQTQAADIFAPIAQDIQDSGVMYADAMRNLTSQLPADQAAGVNMNTARELNASSRLANAYKAQAAITPAVNQLTQYQQDFNSYAAQTFAQQMAQQAAAMGGGGGQDLASLLAP